MIKAQVQLLADGAIVFDGALGIVPTADWFSPEYWTDRDQVFSIATGGRGGVVFATTPVGVCALRHYHRGGAIARLSADRYVWTGQESTRSFAEFRLLAQLANDGLPVPQPVAARYSRQGLGYRADLLTCRIASASTLATRVQERSLDAALGERVGRTIARFHAAHVCHADLNAHNILVGESPVNDDDAVWLIDFDRGRLRRPMAMWRRSNLSRLRRSLEKLGATRDVDFESRFWEPLLAGYRPALVQALPSAAPSGTMT